MKFQNFLPLVALTNLIVSTDSPLFTGSEHISIPSHSHMTGTYAGFIPFLPEIFPSSQKNKKEKRKKKEPKKKEKIKNKKIYIILLLDKVIYFVYPFVLQVVSKSGFFNPTVFRLANALGGNKYGVESVKESNPYQQKSKWKHYLQRKGGTSTQETQVKNRRQENPLYQKRGGRGISLLEQIRGYYTSKGNPYP